MRSKESSRSSMQPCKAVCVVSVEGVAMMRRGCVRVRARARGKVIFLSVRFLLCDGGGFFGGRCRRGFSGRTSLTLRTRGAGWSRRTGGTGRSSNSSATTPGGCVVDDLDQKIEQLLLINPGVFHLLDNLFAKCNHSIY